MVKIALTGGAYEARSIIADAQRCVNLYPENNPQGASSPFTYYPTPGLRKLVRAGEGAVPWRGLYSASNGVNFGVAGRTVYSISDSWVLTSLGSIESDDTQVSMIDNGTTLFIVDGTAKAWKVDLATMAFSQLVDGTGLFLGASSVAYLDSFVLFNRPGTKIFISTLSASDTFDGTYFAQKTTSPDLLKAVATKQQEIWLIGDVTSEVWYNVGESGFPFQRMPGILVEFGTVAPDSIARETNGLYWLAKNRQGDLMVVRAEQYQPERISTYAIEAAIGGYSVVDDAIGTTYLMDGHMFYELTFPTEGKTWVYDHTEKLWHEKAYLDPVTGTLGRSRVNCHAFMNGTHVVGDYESGWLYEMAMGIYTDFDGPVVRIRSFPHLGAEGKRTIFNQFLADLQIGEGDLEVTLRWSDTRGRTWGTPVKKVAGSPANFLAVLNWWNLGMARDKVFELSWSSPTKTALQGAFIDIGVAET